MDDLISPKYLVHLANEVEKPIWKEFGTYRDTRNYVEKWHLSQEVEYSSGYTENFQIVTNGENIDLNKTLNELPDEILIKMAIDLGVETPDFIPSIPTFRNSIKDDYKNAYNAFVNACKQIETGPSNAIGLANSALEGIIKEILQDDRIKKKSKYKELKTDVINKKTLYQLSSTLLNAFKFSDTEMPKGMPIEIKTIGSSLLAINQAIEQLRSEKTNFHGKTSDDYLIQDSMYAYFIINSVSTVGLFLNTFYKTKFPKFEPEELPF